MDGSCVQVWLLPRLGRQVLPYAGRTDCGCDIDPLVAVPNGRLGGAGVFGCKRSSGQPEVDNMGARPGNSPTKTIQVGWIGRREMTQQRIDVVNSESLHHHRRELFDIYAGNAGLPVATGRSCNVGTEGPGGDSQPITRRGGKVQMRMTSVVL